MLSVDGIAGQKLGEVVDLSPSGAGLLVPEAIARGTRVSLRLDAAALPDPFGDGALPPIAGVVASLVELEGARFRIGIAFLEANVQLECRLSRLDKPLARGSGVTRVPHQSDLTATPAGRESLYQCALANLRQRHLADAHKAAKLAAVADPDNRHYRALLFRIVAEQALAAGALADARRHIDRARQQLPVYPELGDLEHRIDGVEQAQRRSSKGLLSRLLGYAG